MRRCAIFLGKKGKKINKLLHILQVEINIACSATARWAQEKYYWVSDS